METSTIEAIPPPSFIEDPAHVEVFTCGSTAIKARCKSCGRHTIIRLPATAGRLADELDHFARIHSLCKAVPR